ncbi:MAG: biotin--[acetyl-CoA-carboxylase] ligase [Gammaproteobacteria bacterium]|nr:biotin--[acetyl-CoA-carboxylase] ligase [Gammaproteobacteria bacterium]
MLSLYKLYTLLAEGTSHSPQTLSQKSGVSAFLIPHKIEQLKEMGLEVRNFKKCYRLKHSIEVLNAEVIRSYLTPLAQSFFHAIETRFMVDSTQDTLVVEVPPHNAVLFAEYQTKGRGRAGRTWVNPLGGQLAFSLLWKTKRGSEDLSGLSLVVGIAVAKTLRHQGVSNLKLKWPNDLILRGKKLGGILIDVLETESSQSVVIGVGMNLRLARTVKQDIHQPVTDLACHPLLLHNRNALAASILNTLTESLRLFESGGCEPFLQEWQSLDFLFGKAIEWKMGDTTQRGVAEGVNARGELCVRQEEAIQAIVCGDISVKALL